MWNNEGGLGLNFEPFLNRFFDNFPDFFLLWGILAFTRSVAREVVTRGIRVNAIAPGWIETAMTDPLGEMRPLLEAQTPMGRIGQPADIAKAVAFLASDDAGWITGQTLQSSGGLML